MWKLRKGSPDSDTSKVRGGMGAGGRDREGHMRKGERESNGRVLEWEEGA